jgi:hypothetical protein
MRQTGADIKSWTEQSTHRSKRPARVFLVSVSHLVGLAGAPGKQNVALQVGYGGEMISFVIKIWSLW